MVFRLVVIRLLVSDFCFYDYLDYYFDDGFDDDFDDVLVRDFTGSSLEELVSSILVI